MKQRDYFRGHAKTLKAFQKDRRKKKEFQRVSRKRKQKNPKISETAQKTTPSKTWESFHRGIRWGIIIGIGLITIYIVIYSPLFRVRRITIQGASSQSLETTLSTLAQEQTSDRHAGVIPGDNVLFLRTTTLLANTQENYPILKSVVVQKQWPNQLTVSVTERQRKIILQTQGRHIDIDEEGIAFQETPPQELQQILQSENITEPVIYTDDTSTINIGERVVEESFVGFASELPDVMSQFTRLEIAKISTPGIHTRELHIETKEGWLLLLDTSRNPENEIKTLNKVVEEKLTKDELEKIELIDLRIREKTYYKLRSN